MRESKKSIAVVGLKVFHYAVAAVMLAMVGMVFVNAVLRYAFRSGIPEAEELARYLFIWICFLGTIAAFKDNQHVGVDLVISHLKGRPKLIISVLSYVFTLFALFIMLIGGVSFLKTGGAAEGPATGIPFGYMSVAIVVASLAMAGIALYNFYCKFIKRQAEEY